MPEPYFRKMGGKKRKVSASIDDQLDADSYATAEFDGSNALVLPGKIYFSKIEEKIVRHVRVMRF